ncbi:homologous recombination OB-fold protein isoform X2 [Dromiciops gliroides]|uniref:homologous recombination OB-fold protein isoform X2 n=1 Tax=Dromiciops gliroides TaxID=33562 RepID=UPI001CC5FC22|nr:homologous recombination OB-fold protein isoform X2 [Dromiciops gliroides]
MKGSPPTFAMACSLQNLFAVEDEFEDEDFLSAVVDTENKFSSSLSVNPGCLKPVCSKPEAAKQARTSGQLTLCPTLPAGASSLSAQGSRLPIPGVPRAGGGSPSKTSTFLRLSPSPSLAGGARDLDRVTPEGLTTEPHAPFSVVNPHPVAGTTVTSKQDVFNNSCMELRQRSSSGPMKSLFPRQKEDPMQVKRPRISELGESCCQGSVVTRLAEPLLSHPTSHHGTPQLIMRPGASSSLILPSGLRTPTQSTPRQAGPRGNHLHVPQPLQVAKCYAQNKSQNSSLTPPPFQSPGSWESGRPRVVGLAVPNPNSSVFPVARSGQRPLESRVQVSSVESLVSTPSTPCTSLASSGILQTPIVTNHLVQLVTATSRTPGTPAHVSTRAKTRRFPGPAGILPHQHSGKNLEEIMISTPQTPTHGALAKFRTEEVPSSQPSEEDFEHGPWVTMKADLGLDDQDPACFLHTYSIVMVLRKAALKQLPRNKVPTMAVMIKSLSRSTVDASVVFRDPTGDMSPGRGSVDGRNLMSLLTWRDARYSAPAAVGRETERAEDWLCPAAEADWSVLTITPKSLPQCDTQQPGPDLQPRFRRWESPQELSALCPDSRTCPVRISISASCS